MRQGEKPSPTVATPSTWEDTRYLLRWRPLADLPDPALPSRERHAELLRSVEAALARHFPAEAGYRRSAHQTGDTLAIHIRRGRCLITAWVLVGPPPSWLRTPHRGRPCAAVLVSRRLDTRFRLWRAGGDIVLALATVSFAVFMIPVVFGGLGRWLVADLDSWLREGSYAVFFIGAALVILVVSLAITWVVIRIDRLKHRLLRGRYAEREFDETVMEVQETWQEFIAAFDAALPPWLRDATPPAGPADRERA